MDEEYEEDFGDDRVKVRETAVKGEYIDSDIEDEIVDENHGKGRGLKANDSDIADEVDFD
jgi:hypothetical protein